MKHLIFFTTGLLVGGYATYSFCSWKMIKQPYQPVEEFKLSYITLTRGKPSPQLREYLKARLYWNASMWISPSGVSDYSFDFGPIDESVLGDACVFKGPESAKEVYERAMQIHHAKGRVPK